MYDWRVTFLPVIVPNTDHLALSFTTNLCLRFSFHLSFNCFSHCLCIGHCPKYDQLSLLTLPHSLYSPSTRCYIISNVEANHQDTRLISLSKIFLKKLFPQNGFLSQETICQGFQVNRGISWYPSNVCRLLIRHGYNRMYLDVFGCIRMHQDASGRKNQGVGWYSSDIVAVTHCLRVSRGVMI